MNINNAHLVIGGGGMIGGALAQSLNLAGINVIASDIWKDNLTTHKIHLDLSADADSWVLPRNIDTAYLCSGRTKLDECRMDPAGTSRVNVAGTIRLIDELIKKNVFVVLLSSNQVFDGKV
jgi:nucleoside-diphosphate-sugar epimerase